MTRHIPMRTCRVCRKNAPKQELQRWVIVDGVVVADKAMTMPSRGYYSCSEACAKLLPAKINQRHNKSRGKKP